MTVKHEPAVINELLACAEKLASPFSFVRVDFFIIGQKIIFGEMTFTPTSGFKRDISPETDLLFGKMLQLPEK